MDLMDGAKEVVVLSADHIYELDYREMIQYHRDRRSAVTIGSIVCPRASADQFGIMVVDDEWRVVDFCAPSRGNRRFDLDARRACRTRLTNSPRNP